MADNPSSTANVGNHPIHPMLVGFPIAFLVGALAVDLAFVATGNPFWAQASLWLIGAALVMGALAAAAGLTDFLGDERIRALPDAWYHFIGNGTAMILALVNFVLRYSQGAGSAIAHGVSCCRSWSSASSCSPAGRVGRWSTAIGLPCSRHRNRRRALLRACNRKPGARRNSEQGLPKTGCRPGGGSPFGPAALSLLTQPFRSDSRQRATIPAHSHALPAPPEA